MNDGISKPVWSVVGAVVFAALLVLIVADSRSRITFPDSILLDNGGA